MRRIFILALLSVFFVFTGAMGTLAKTTDGSKSDPYQLKDSIVVSATRIPTKLREIGSSVTVITKSEINKAQVAYVSEILNTVPGLDVVQSGGKGGQVSVFIRGGNSHHALVMVDGVKMNDPSSPSSAYDFSGMGTENIERIEILRGPQSLLYGSDAISGVISIFTQKGVNNHDGTSLKVKSEMGDQATFRQTIQLSGSKGKLDYSAIATRKITDGISSASKQFGGKEKDGLKNTSLSANLGYRVTSNLDINLTTGYSERKSDLDQSFGDLDDPNYTLNQIEKYLALRVNDRSIGKSWTHSAGISFTRHDRDSEDKFDQAHPTDASVTLFNGWRLKFDWQHNIRIDKRNTIISGLEVERERFNQELAFTSMFGLYKSSVPEISKRTVAIYAMFQSNLIDRLYTTVGLRHDNHEQFGSVTTYRVTGAYLFEKPNLKLKMSYGTAFKAPSLSQLYDPTWGNSNLQPEESKAWEAGFDLNMAGGVIDIGITYFHSEFTNLIENDPAQFIPINRARALAKGLEAGFKLTFASFTLRGDYTYTEASNEVSRESLIRRPAHKGSLSVEYLFGKRAVVLMKVRGVGRRDDIDFLNFPAHRVSLPDFTIVDLNSSIQITGDLKLFGSLRNILHRQYVEVFSYGVLPRSGYFGVELSL